MWRAVHSSLSVDGIYHISDQPHQCARSTSAAFKAQQAGLQTLCSWGLGQKRDSPWYWTRFKYVNKSSFTGNGNPGFRAGPRRSSLCLAPYQLCLTHKGRVKSTAEQILWWHFMCEGKAVLNPWLIIGRAAEETESHSLSMNRSSTNFCFLAIPNTYKDSSPKIWVRLTLFAHYATQIDSWATTIRYNLPICHF